VLLKDGSVLIATISLNPTTKKAILTTSTLAAGSHLITATYSGNPDNLASTSPAITVAVNKSVSTTTLVSSLNPSTFGRQVMLSATVSSSSGAPVAGTVLFKDGTATLGSAVVTPSTQKAVILVNSFAAGSHALTATFGGSTTDASSISATLIETVAKSPVTVTLSGTPNPSMLGRPVTFTATVTSPFDGTVSGLVDFKVGGVKFATAAVNATTHQTSYNGLRPSFVSTHSRTSQAPQPVIRMIATL
jgi:large repetitive protein